MLETISLLRTDAVHKDPSGLRDLYTVTFATTSSMCLLKLASHGLTGRLGETERKRGHLTYQNTDTLASHVSVPHIYMLLWLPEPPVITLDTYHPSRIYLLLSLCTLLSCQSDIVQVLSYHLHLLAKIIALCGLPPKVSRCHSVLIMIPVHLTLNPQL